MSTSTEQASKQRLELAVKLDITIDTFRGLIKSNNNFRSIIGSFPRMTAEHNRAKKKLVAVRDDAETKFDAAAILAADIAAALRTI